MITEAIKNFPKQFEFDPEVKNADKLAGCSSVVVGGMGGSGLVGGILRIIQPELNVHMHHEYGLPMFIRRKDEHLFIAVSYSGNTEETIDFFEAALKGGYPTAAVSVGGKLLEVAKEHSVPYVALPDTGIQPRMALGFALRAVLKLIGANKLLEESGALASVLEPLRYENTGKELAETMRGKVPIIYTSRSNQAIAYNWKIKFNETGKVPAFYNTFPELNHNEMAGFDVNDRTKMLSERMHFIFITDEADHPRIRKRMEITREEYARRSLPVATLALEGATKLQKIFRSLLIADWASYYTAEIYRNEPEAVRIIEDFKKQLR